MATTFIAYKYVISNTFCTIVEIGIQFFNLLPNTLPTKQVLKYLTILI